jgi:YidC/Oxa1 family membrane protein insertase
MFNTLLVQPLFNLLAVIYALLPGHDFGVAIIILTIIVRLLLWPLVNRQLHSQRALQKLQPEINRVKAQAGGDKQKEGQMIMELYKEKEINPFASFLPLLIQLPIFFALFIVLRDIIKPGEFAHLAYPAVKHMAAIAAITNGGIHFQPTLFGLIDLTKPSPLLAALAAAAQFFQTRQLTPKKTVGDTQAQVLSGMNYIFPFLTFIIGLTLPSALALYWVTTSSVAILQQTLVLHRDVEELEEGVTITQPAKPKRSKAKAKRRKA